MNHGFAVDRATLAGERHRDACVAVRRLELRHRAQGQAGVLGAVPPGGVSRPARQPLSVRAVRRDDAQMQVEDPHADSDAMAARSRSSIGQDSLMDAQQRADDETIRPGAAGSRRRHERPRAAAGHDRGPLSRPADHAAHRLRSRRGRERPRGVRGHAVARALQSARDRARRLCRDAAQLLHGLLGAHARCRRAPATPRWSSRSAWFARSPPTPDGCAPKARSSAAAGGSRPPRAASPMPAAGCSRTRPRPAWCSSCRRNSSRPLPLRGRDIQHACRHRILAAIKPCLR